jgi:signal peptide peptidase SppA
MINLGVIWSLCSAYAPSAFEQLAAIIKAGPVEDAGRAGLQIKKIGSTALIEMRGPMLKSAGWALGWGVAGSVETEQAMIAAANDPDVESILWVIDSAGGSVDGLDSLYNTVAQVNQEKPVTVQVDGMMASAALYVASAANSIYANKRDLVGSIGARMMLYDFSEMFKNEGIKAIPIDTGEHKSAGAMGTPISKEQIAEFQKIVDGYFADFKDAVITGRKMDKGSFDALADGRIFFANEEPIQSGLIDGIRSTRSAFADMLKRGDNDQARRRARARMKLLEIS